MARFPLQFQSQDQNGKIIEGGTVIISLTGTDTAITVYAASAGGSAVTDAKFTTDSDGRIKAWVDESDYASTQYFRITMSGSEFVTQTIDDVSIVPVSIASSATVALDNLSSVAINTSLVSDTADTDDLGTEAISWKQLYLGSGGISFEGATDDDFQTTVNVTDPTADNAITIPDTTDTLVGKATTDTLTNKTLTTPTIASFTNATHDHADAAGGGNTLLVPTIASFANAAHGHTSAASGGMLDINYAKNLIINGDFDIWQRGTSFAAIANTAYGADRFFYGKSGAMVHTLSRVTDVPTQAESGHLSNYALKLDNTTADSSIAAGDVCALVQRVEGYNWKHLSERSFTFSFWHKHTVTGTNCVAFVNSGADRSYVAEYTQSVTDTWEKATINVSASPSAGTWDTVNGSGLKIRFTLDCGSTFQTTADTWQTGNYYGTSSQANNSSSTSNNFIISQVQLEQGDYASDFDNRDIATENLLCKRYYEEINNSGNVGWVYGIGQCLSATSANVIIAYEVEKRATPSISRDAATDFIVTAANGAATDVTVMTFTGVSVLTCNPAITTASGLVAGNATRLIDDTGGSSNIIIDAEL